MFANRQMHVRNGKPLWRRKGRDSCVTVFVFFVQSDVKPMVNSSLKEKPSLREYSDLASYSATFASFSHLPVLLHYLNTH